MVREDRVRGARERQADKCDKTETIWQTGRGRETRELTGAQTGWSRSQRDKRTQIQMIIETDRWVERGRWVIMWVRLRQVSRQIVMSVVFTLHRTLAQQVFGGIDVCALTYKPQQTFLTFWPPCEE